MFSKTLLSILPLSVGLANAVPLNQLDARQAACVISGGYEGGGGGGERMTIIQKVITTEIVAFPVLINTFIPSNTVINFYGDVVINVNNAPTQLLTIATGTSTATNTATTTVVPAPNGGDINIFQTTNIVNFPVIISTFIQQNTIIQGGGGVNIVINNAPTFIITTATGTSTTTETVTSTVTTNNSGPTTFILSPLAVGVARKARRQTTGGGQFVAADGSVVANCADAVTYTIENGRLSTGSGFVSTNNGTASSTFQASQAIGDISTTFSVADDLAWDNPAFSGGSARFCSTGSDIFALFTTAAIVPGCSDVTLLAIPAAACNNGVISTSSSSSTSSSTSTSASSSSTSSSNSTTTSSSSSSTTSSSSSVDPSTTSSSSSTASTTSTTSPTPTALVCPLLNQTPNAAGTECVCTEGFENTGIAGGALNCVLSPLVCGLNQAPNAAGTECVCADGFENTGVAGGALNCVVTPTV